MWWCTPEILVLWRLRQEDHKLKTSLSFIVRPDQNNNSHKSVLGRNQMRPVTPRSKGLEPVSYHFCGFFQ